MGVGHYNHIESGASLQSLLPAKQFRTISSETRKTVPLTPNEVAVTISMKPAFASQLDFPVPWDGILYGVIRKSELLQKLGTDENGVFWVKLISCNDWDDRFLLVLESDNAEQYRAFYIMEEEVLELLKNCLRIPEQRN